MELVFSFSSNLLITRRSRRELTLNLKVITPTLTLPSCIYSVEKMSFVSPINTITLDCSGNVLPNASLLADVDSNKVRCLSPRLVAVLLHDGIVSIEQ